MLYDMEENMCLPDDIQYLATSCFSTPNHFEIRSQICRGVGGGNREASCEHVPVPVQRVVR